METTKLRDFDFAVKGMHCRACVALTESELLDLPTVHCATSDLRTRTVHVTGDFGEKNAEAVAAELTLPLAKHGYALSVRAAKTGGMWGEFIYAAPIAAVFVIGFILLQKAGLANLISGGKLSFGAAFIIGIIASLSSCMAVVGGIALSLSATSAKSGRGKTPQLFFLGSRMATFFVLGGAIGALGAAFRPNGTTLAILGAAAGLAMLLVGLNLLDVFRWTRVFQFSLPSSFARGTLTAAKTGTRTLPLLLGVATFFLPCGFTQSLQLYALTTGSFLAGAKIMSAFALGTLPVLALMSFSALGAGKRSGIFFKSAGLIVIFFALLNLSGSLAAIGIIPPLFTI